MRSNTTRRRYTALALAVAAALTVSAPVVEARPGEIGRAHV